MITIKNVKTFSGAIVNHTIDSPLTQVIDGEQRLLMMPAMIDVDAMIPTASLEKKAHLYLEAGITTIFDAVACSAIDIPARLQQIEQLAAKNGEPLRVELFYDGNLPEEFDTIGKIKSSVVAIKISLDLAEKPIAPPHTSALDRLFQIAAQENMIVVIALLQGKKSVADQRETAWAYVEQAINLAEKYSTGLCLQHVRTHEELELIKKAKERGLLIYVEVAYPHLFLNNKEFPQGITFNDATLFLPNERDQADLWDGVRDGAIDMIGSAGIFSPPALLLPLLFEAQAEKRISMDRIVEITRINQEAIFRLPPNQDVVLIDPKNYKEIPQTVTNGNPIFSRWQGKSLSGWPVHIITSNKVISLP